MSATVYISFYEEGLKANIPNQFSQFKQMIANHFLLELADVSELKMSFSSKSIISTKLNSEQIYLHLYKAAITQTDIITINIEISENSRLFQKEVENSKKQVAKPVKEEKKMIEQVKEVVEEKQNNLRRLLKLKTDFPSPSNQSSSSSNYQHLSNKENISFEKPEKHIKNDKEVNDVNQKLEELKRKMQKESDKKEDLLRKKAENEKYINIENTHKKEFINIEENKQIIKPQVIENKQVQPPLEILDSDLSIGLSKLIIDNMEAAKEEILKKTLKEAMQMIEKVKTQNSLDSFVHCSNNVSLFQSTNAIHKGITCFLCKISPIVGHRFKCSVCVNFDLCNLCEEKHSESHGHPFIKIRKPEQIQEYKIEDNNRKGSSQFELINNVFSIEENKNKNFANNLKQKQEIQKQENQKQEKVNIKPIQNNRWDKLKKDKFRPLVKKVREQYLLENITDDQIIEALIETSGDIDQTVCRIFCDA
jgi:hypothetical protein